MHPDQPPRTLILSRIVFIFFAVLLGGCASEPNIDYHLSHTYGLQSAQFPRAVGGIFGPALLGGNRIESLSNGDEIFPAMLDAIRSARRSIDLETYIYWGGDIGQTFAAALSERAAAGVRVHVLLDWGGSIKMDPQLIKRMKGAGVSVAEYRPLSWYEIFSSHIDNRTHRKILVVDGQIGFTGGVGIADIWNGHAQDPDHWRDMHYRFTGPVVAQMQGVFLANWLKTTGEVLDGTDYFPPLAPAGDSRCQAIKSGLDGGSENIELMYLMSITASERSLRLGSAYFVPDAQTRKALIAARRRGVRVQILIPGKHLDETEIRPASRISWGELLRSGIEIYEYEPTMYHTKLFIADDLWVSIGSSNMDNRSFRLNDEANVNVLDRNFAIEQSRLFDADLQKSHRVTLQEWENRPWIERFNEALAQVLAPQL